MLPIEATKAKGRGDESRQRLIYFHIFIPNKYIHTNEHSIHLEKTNDRHQRPHAHRLLLLARSALKNDVRAASLSASIAVVCTRVGLCPFTRRNAMRALHGGQCSAFAPAWHALVTLAIAFQVYNIPPSSGTPYSHVKVLVGGFGRSRSVAFFLVLVHSWTMRNILPNLK